MKAAEKKPSTNQNAVTKPQGKHNDTSWLKQKLAARSKERRDTKRRTVTRRVLVSAPSVPATSITLSMMAIGCCQERFVLPNDRWTRVMAP